MPGETTTDPRQAVIDRLNNTDLSALKRAEDEHAPKDIEIPADDDAEIDDATEQPDETDDAEEQPDDADADEGADAVEDIKQELAELKQQLQKQATTPGGTGASPADAPAQSASKTFAGIREKLAKAKTEWGTLVEETGLEDLVDQLEPLIGTIETLKKSADESKAREAQQHLERSQQAVAFVHQSFDKMAKGNPELARMIGGNGARATKSELELRQLILSEAQIEQDRSARLSGGKKTLSDEDALQKATAIVFRERTGKALYLNTGERLAVERGRMVTPSRGGTTTGDTKDSIEAGRQRATANVESFLRSRGG